MSTTRFNFTGSLLILEFIRYSRSCFILGGMILSKLEYSDTAEKIVKRFSFDLHLRVINVPPLSFQGKYKAPTNAQKKNDGTYSYATDKTAEELYPKLSSAAGTNFFDSKAHWMSMLIKGPDPFTIKTSPKVGVIEVFEHDDI